MRVKLDALSGLRKPVWDSEAVLHACHESMQNNVHLNIRKPESFARAVVQKFAHHGQQSRHCSHVLRFCTSVNQFCGHRCDTSIDLGCESCSRGPDDLVLAHFEF